MLDYSLEGVAYTPTVHEAVLIANNTVGDPKDWDRPCFSAYKANLKTFTLLKQFDRCAYCRRKIEVDGYYEPLEHIVAKTLKPTWILLPTNLIVTCNTCNNLKNDEQTLDDAYLNVQNYPAVSQAFKIFHPYFDKWGDHLEYEDEIFLVGKQGSKGLETIKVCRLYRYHVIVNRVKELQIGQQSSAKKIMHRLRTVSFDSKTANELYKAVDHLLDRMQDMPGY